LFVPEAGDYLLRVTWRASDVGLQGEPCIDAWGAVDLGLALSATSPTSHTKDVSARRPRTPYEAYRMSRTPSTVESADSTYTRGAGGVIADDRLARRFGPLSVPAYDIVRLHQAALEYEMAPCFSHELLAALRARRQKTLEDGLRTTPDALCRAARAHAL